MDRWEQPLYMVPIDGKWAKFSNRWMQEMEAKDKKLYRWFDYYISEYQKNPISFFLPHGPDHPIHGNHGRAFLNDYEHDFILVLAPNQAQPLDTPIMTPTGNKAMGDLLVGDKVIGSDGNPCNVVSVHEHPSKPCYEFTFDNNEISTIATGNHLWKYMTHNHAYKHKIDAKHKNGNFNQWDVVTTDQIIAQQGIDGNPQKAGYIPVCDPVQFTDGGDMLIKPYTLGALLGDGCMCNAACSFSNDDPDIINRVKSELEGIGIVRSSASSGYEFRIIGYRTFGMPKNEVKTELTRLSMTHKANGKYIPDEYKYTTEQKRRDVLAGLVDTDGSCSPKGHCEYYSVSKRLAEDVAWLVRSLGGKAKIRSKKAYYIKDGVRHDCQDCYRVVIRMKTNPFWLKRKADRWKASTRRNGRVVRTIKEVGTTDCRCIVVDSPDHTYLCNDFIVTHNTGKSYIGAGYTILRSIPCDPNWTIFKEHGVICPEWKGPQQVVVGTYSWDLMNGIWNTYRTLLPRHELGDYSPNWGRFPGEEGRSRNIRFHNIGKEVVLNCGTKLIFKCYRQSLAQWESIQCDIAHLDEQCDEDRYDALSQRQITRGDFTPIITTFTGHVIPDRPDTGAAGWIKQKIVDRGVTKGRSVGFYHLDIPSTPTAIMTNKQKAKLKVQWVTEPEANRDFSKIEEGKARYHGQWQHGAGLTFEEFSEDIHVIQPFNMKKYKPTYYRMIDHGTKPCPAALFAVFPWGDTVLFEETYEDVTSVKQGCVNIRKMSNASVRQVSEDYWEEVDGDISFAASECDCRSFGTKSPDSGKTIGQLYNENGVSCYRASGQTDDILMPMLQEQFALYKDRQHIDVTIKRREKNELDKMGCPMLYITENCYNSVAELRKYAGKDKDDHLISCLTGDTIVTCMGIDKPIAEVLVGDMVLTRAGYKKVLGSEMTSASADILELTCSNGTTIRGTGEHPFFSPLQNMFIKLIKLTKDMVLYTHSSSIQEISCSAERYSLPGNTNLLKPVRVVAVNACETKEPVYNLQIEDQPEFFANDVLVHNCLKFFSGRDRPYQGDGYMDYREHSFRLNENPNESASSEVTGY